MKQKKIMLLGGLRYLIPVIKAAHKQGYYVITCDYIPENTAHKYSDKYCNISVTDKDAVLREAMRLDIDGIISFAVDPGVVTAAYVQEKMGLPALGPYESVCILQNKDLFRAFLSDNGFNTPKAWSFDSFEKSLAMKTTFPWPCIVKPVDSAGSKGVTKVNCEDDLEHALSHAFSNSQSNRIIVEEYIKQKGCSSDSDCFSVNGTLKFVSFSSQRFDNTSAGPFVPAAFSWPSTMSAVEEKELTSEIQRLLTLLRMDTSIYNIETRIGTNGKPYIMEVSPRGGGNRIAEMILYSTGIDLITATVRAAVGDKVESLSQRQCCGHWAEVIIHADADGIFNGLVLDSEFEALHVVETDLWVSKGDSVNSFRGANDALGTIVLKFDSDAEMLEALDNTWRWMSVKLA